MVILPLGAALVPLLAWAPSAAPSPSQGAALGQDALETERSIGRRLVDELRCAACHGDLDTGRDHVLPGPDLSAVGGRVLPGFLARYLADPEAAHPGTNMPRLALERPGPGGGSAADVLADLQAYLLSRGLESPAEEPPRAGGLDGEGLFHQVGCVACHAPRRAPAELAELPPALAEAVGLAHVPDKYSRAALARFLFHPEAARPAGRMPDMGLSRSEAQALAAYLLPEPVDEPGVAIGAERAARGAEHYAALGCAGCHEPPGAFAAAATALADMDPAAGCLDPLDTATPRYGLKAGERAAIAAYLAQPGPPATDELRVLEILAANRCTACHDRGAVLGATVEEPWGGVHPSLDPYFATDEPDLGDHARLPPTLHLVGARLRTEWLRGVLFHGQGVRPYMHTRMPRYVERELGSLPALLDRVDRVEPYPMQAAQGQEGGEQRRAGAELMGTTGLACILCHNFNGQPSPGFGGMDLVTCAERLQSDWFARFLLEPQRYRPGIVMPESWPGGEAAHAGILGGNTEAQVAALWYFLEQGRTARNPQGIRSEPTHLDVAGEVLTYRGRSDVAGYRGIAVGSPAGLHYAFDAQNGALGAIWIGDFLSVNWSGQGSGNFRPRERVVALPRDLAFYRLADGEAPWPRMPVRDRENPSKDKRGNPDPEYPGNLGFRFLGYELDGERVPTLRYMSGEVQIADRLTVSAVTDPKVLRRTLTFEARAAETLWMRPLVGEVEELPAQAGAKGRFRSGGVRLDLRHAEALGAPLLRPLAGGTGDERELLLPIALPQGTTQLVIDYALLQ